MRWLVFLAALGWTVPAAAQSTRFGSGPVPLGISLQSPTDIDCSPPSDTCKPLNLAACDDAEGATRELAVSILPLALPYTTDARLYVWVQKMQTTANGTVPSCTFETGSQSQIPIDGYFSVDLFGTGPLTSTNFEFPADLSSSLTLTVGDFLTATGPLAAEAKVVQDACSSGVEQQYLLCFGLDYTGSINGLAADGNVTPLTENTAWVEIDVDTVPPPSVTSVTAAPGDGHVTLTPTTSADVEGGEDWFAAVRPIGDAAAATGTDCREWTGAKSRTVTASTNPSFDFGGLDNGTLYEGCVALVDRAGNPGEGFASFVAEPFNQCDFAECYPGELRTGCSAVGATPLAAALALLLLRRRTRKDRP